MDWITLARKTIEKLGEYDRAHMSDYGYFFLTNQNTVSETAALALAECMEKANKELVWQKVPRSSVDS